MKTPPGGVFTPGGTGIQMGAKPGQNLKLDIFKLKIENHKMIQIWYSGTVADQKIINFYDFELFWAWKLHFLCQNSETVYQNFENEPK